MQGMGHGWMLIFFSTAVECLEHCRKNYLQNDLKYCSYSLCAMSLPQEVWCIIHSLKMGSELQYSVLCTKLYNITHALIICSVKLILKFKSMQKILHLSLRISKYSVFFHAKQRWNLYLKSEAVQKTASPLVDWAVVNNSGILNANKHA